MSPWNPADNPPKSEVDTWSREVVAITNLGTVHLVSYFNGLNGGCWQRPIQFGRQTEVVAWIDQPNIDFQQR